MSKKKELKIEDVFELRCLKCKSKRVAWVPKE
jgi:hypothetical protein